MPNDMRDRLIELIKECDKRESDIMFKEKRAMSFDKWCGLYADCLIENGAIIPPCVPKDDEYHRVYDEHGNYIAVIYSEKGKTVFLTREDAEKALGERE